MLAHVHGEAAKSEAQKQWNATPCGTAGMTDPSQPGTQAFFDEMVRLRYVRDDPWVPDVLKFEQWRGRKVLEIGHGMGCDLTHMAKAGAIAHGIDITQRHHDICKSHLALHGLDADLRLTSASAIPHPDNTFDLVYSLGVLHHTNDTVRCISEAYRVLKPGGTFIMAMYHWRSLFHAYVVLRRGILQGKLWKIGYRNTLSTVEYGADGVNIKPLVKLYTPRIVRNITADFTKTDIEIRGLAYDRIPLTGKITPAPIGRAMERTLGWYVVSRSVK